MLKRYKNIILFTTLIILSIILSGCSLFKRDMSRAESYEVVIVEDEDKLENDSYYVKKNDGTFHRLHIGNNNFKKSKTSSAEPKRVAWFGKDFDKIPTMYKDESIVYHTTSPFEEGIVTERFADSGFTIGIAGLKKTSTGRYMFSTSPSDFNLDINSSAGQVYELGDKKAILDSIGNAELREGNVSPSGTIIGLEEGKTYSTYIYVGTQANHYNITADVRALTSFECTTLWDFKYNKKTTIEFTFPSYFNSGYYFINGFGIVRYVNGTTQWDEKMDMNIPNDYNNADKDHEDGDGTKKDLEAQTVLSENIKIIENGRYNIEVSYEQKEGMPIPTVKIVGPNGATSLKPAGDGILAIQTDLEIGDYELQLIGLESRAYTYRVVNSSVETNGDSNNNTNDNSKIEKTNENNEADESDESEKDNAESAAEKVKKALENTKK